MSLFKVSLLQLKRKKFRTAVLVVSVMLALSLLVGLNAGVDGLQKTYNDLVGNSLGYTDIIVKSNVTAPAFSTQPLELLLQNEPIAAYSFRVQYWMPFASADGHFNGTSGGYLLGINPEADENFGSYKISEGNYASITQALEEGNNSCVLSESFAQRLNLHAGDILMLGYYNLSESLPAAPSQTLNLTVACIIQDYGRTYWFDPEDPTTFRRVNSDITINLNVAQALFYLNQIEAIQAYIHLEDLKQAQNVHASLQKGLGSDYSVGNLKATMYESVQQNFSTYNTITYIVGGMALMIAAMLLLNTMLTNVSERKREIGILRSVGASKTQVFGMFMTELLPVTLLGALASIPLSMVAASLITSILPAIYVDNVGTASAVEFSFPLSTLISGLAIGVVMTLFVGFVPALLACRVNPVEALHPQMRSFHTRKKARFLLPSAGFILTLLGLFLVQNGFSASTSWFPTATVLLGYVATLVGAVLLASALLSPLSKAFAQLLKPFIARASVIVHRNILLNFRRSVFSYGALAISIAVLVSFSSLVTTAASYNLEVDKQSVGADVQIWVNAPVNFADQLEAVEGVRNVAGVGYVSYRQSNMTFNSHQQDNIMITGIASEEYFATIYETHLTNTLNDMTTEQVYALLNAGEGKVILQDALARNLTVQVGDTLTWSITNQTGTYKQDLQVIATADFVAGRWETISKFAQGYYAAIVSFGDMQGFRHSLLASNLDEFYVSLDSSANVTQVVNDLNQACYDAGYSPTIYTAKETLAQTQASFDQTEMLAVSVTAFFLVVGALGITAATAYTVVERKREIAVLTALGMDKRQNRIVIAGEALLLAFIGTVVGLVSGLGLSLFAINAIPWWANAPAPSLVLSPFTLAVAVVVIVVSAVLSAVYPANRISKLNTVDALRE
ncbi:MAG: FtsX-like permease family protein [Candidatus Bathyarchaeota archaeon]|nr:FtsX-like permease family protein [Candidatus Bathyarchaeota archaeon]